MPGVFLDASALQKRGADELMKLEIRQSAISFAFPDGFTKLRLIEECRALNALDVSDPDNFDLMYDIMMQMLTGKTLVIRFRDAKGDVHDITQFLVTDRYMDLRFDPIIDSYPVLVNWLVEYVAALLGKKFPRSLNDIRAAVSAREELMKKSPETKEETSPQLPPGK